MTDEDQRDARRYRAMREAKSMLKLYEFADQTDPFSGDWNYKPTPEQVDAFADRLLAQL